MPAKSNAEKRHRQSEVHRMRNRMTKSRVRTENKKFLDAVEAKDVKAAETEFREFMKLIDTAGRKGVYHKNTAARKKSRLQKQLNALKKTVANPS
ncbi:MAG TPA: 30S ribosomal protein S20 [Spirochaetia bacterium]|nr:30S ribosomal protein S20 [Spirochaetia bacterium]